MNESIKNPSESIGELFLMAYGGLDPLPALTMIRDYGISGFYLSNDNVPDRKTAQDLSRILQEGNKKNGQFLPLLLGVDQEGTWSVMAEDQQGRWREDHGLSSSRKGALLMERGTADGKRHC